MLKILHIKKSAEFQKIGKKCEKFYSHTILLLSAKTPEKYFQNLEEDKRAKDFCRVGFTVAKTVSKSAVARNLAKRRMREAFAKLALKYAKNHHDYVVIARREILSADFAKISQDLKFCLSKIHNFKKDVVRKPKE
jgi:ribonuclease P protein component